MGELTVLLPSGIRVKVTTSPRMLLLKVLELACAKHKLDPESLGLKRSGGLTGSKALIDLTSPVQFSGIPNCAVLEAVDAVRLARPCRVALAPPNGGQRVTKEFAITTTLWDILAHWDAEDPSLQLTTTFEEPSPGSSTERDDVTTESAAKQSRAAHRLFMLPACRIVREEINTLNALRTTTLKMLGLNGGKALITVRYTKTKISEDELTKALADGGPTAGSSDHAAEMKRLKAARRAADDADDEEEVERLSKLIKALRARADDRGAPEAAGRTAAAAAAAPAAATLADAAVIPMDLDPADESSAVTASPAGLSSQSDKPGSRGAYEATAAVQGLVLTPDLLVADDSSPAGVVVAWQTAIDSSSRDRLRKKLLNAAVQGLAPEERVSRLDEFVGRVAKVEAKIWDGSGTADEYYERVSEKLMKIKLRNASPDEPTFAGRQPVPMQKEAAAAAPILVEYYQPPEQAQTQPKASASKKIARPKPTVEEAPPPIVIPDRALRVLRTGESGQIVEEEVDDSFFDVTAAEAKAMLETAKKLQEPSEAPLLTAYSRKRIQAEKDARYQVCRIRVYFPDRFVLQFMAHPQETVSAITDTVKDALEDPSLPFYLFTTPPKTVLSDPKRSLLRENLVPKANVRIGAPKPDSGDSGGKALALKADLQKEVATVAEVHSPKPAANPINKVSATDILATVSGRGGSASASASASASPVKPKGSGPVAGKGKGAGSQFLRLSNR